MSSRPATTRCGCVAPAPSSPRRCRGPEWIERISEYCPDLLAKSTLTELAVDYAKQREQFGRTIGSFQAVKHICADMFVRTELARVAVHAAAVTCDDDSADDASRAVAGAKLLADEAATVNSRSCVQVHGGMGFTWEVPVHFFLKRAWLHATEFGTADDHAEALAELL